MLSSHRGHKRDEQLIETVRVLSSENVREIDCESHLKLLCNMENRILERELKVIPLLAKILQQYETDPTHQILVSLTLQTLANLALNEPLSQYEIYSDTIVTLISIVQNTQNTDILIKALRVLVTLACHHLVVFHMIERLKIHEIVLPLICGERKIKEYDVLVQLLNLARNFLLNENLQGYFIDNTLLVKRLLFLASDHALPEIIVNNAIILLSLVAAFRDDYRKLLISEGVLPQMATLLNSVSPQTLTNVLSTLTNIAIAEEYFLQTDCIPQLTHLLYGNVDEILEGAASVLSNLCNHDEVRASIDASGGSKICVCFLLTSSNFQVQLAGAKLVGNLALTPSIAEKLVKFGARKLIKNLVEKNQEVEAIKTMSHKILENMSNVPETADASILVSADGSLEMSRRQKIALEVLSTETSYMTSLGLALKFFYVPIKMMDDKAIISQDDLKMIFSIFDTIYKLNAEFFKDIKPLVDTWSEDTQIGNSFLQFSHRLRLYTEYVNNYENAMTTYMKCLKNPTFKAFCEKARDSTRGLDLPSYLIMPVQRIPRYIMLIQDYKNNTEKDHPDYHNLGKALETMKSIADHINEEKRNQERRMRMVQLSNTMTHSEALGKLVVPGRLLIKEGPVIFHGENNKISKYGYLFLFNDMMLYTKKSKEKEKFDLKQFLKLDERLEVKGIPDTETVANAMQITNHLVNMKVSLDSKKERDLWLSEFNEAFVSHVAKAKTYEQ